MNTGSNGRIMSLDARGKFGYSGGFGRIAFGYTRLGFYNWFCGIYQKKTRHGKSFISRMRFYRPTNNQLPGQQSWRGVMASAVLAWQALTPPARAKWAKIAIKKKMSGYNAFLSYYLRTHV